MRRVTEPGGERLKSRRPSFVSLVSVYTVIATLVYGWMAVIFLWKLPSWLLILNFGEVLATLSYTLVSALVESLLLLALITAICLLPKVWTTQENFIVHGSWLAMGGYGSLMLIMKLNQLPKTAFVPYWWWASLAGLVITILLTVFSPRIQSLRNVALWVADRFQVFLFILIPSSALALINVILRNLG